MNKPTGDINIRGVSFFFYGLVPWALAIGAMGWLVFGEGLKEAVRHDQLEHRRAEAVAAPDPAHAPLTVELDQSGFIHLDKVVMDGPDLTINYRNRNGKRACFIKLHAQEIAPNGDSVKDEGDYANPGELAPGEAAQTSWNIGLDWRATLVRVRVDGQDAC